MVLKSLLSLKTAYLTGAVSLIVVPDLLLELLLELAHLAFEVLHLAFELFEQSLDHVVEHLFHTGVHETQVIVFYIICSLVLFALYRLKLAMPRFYRFLKAKIFGLLASVKASIQQLVHTTWFANKATNANKNKAF